MSQCKPCILDTTKWFHYVMLELYNALIKADGT